MRILLLAPHPFYQERGTPIAVNLLLQSLSAAGHTVDVLTYHEGQSVDYPGITLHRIRRPLFANQVPPGPSLKKILCDLHMLPRALAMARQQPYDVIHAVEESVYMAMLIRRRVGTPYLYDMDSSLARQIAEKFPFLGFLLPILRGSERAAIRNAMAVVPVCRSLADLAREEGAAKIVLLRDVSLLKPASLGDVAAVRQLFPPPGPPRFLYVGNLESYQGLDLLLESFGAYLARGGTACLIVAGGKPADIQKYSSQATTRGIHAKVHFIGPQPVGRMAALFQSADVLVSPRIKGNNTPMKIYSYLASGKAILATDLPTHTEVLTTAVAVLAPPQPEAWADAMQKLASDPVLRERLGTAGRQLAAEAYSVETFDRTVGELYDWIKGNLPAPGGKGGPDCQNR
jgi:glycosyltransferase involved in cell wall biosynthesis